jgi:hypothetical protein
MDYGKLDAALSASLSSQDAGGVFDVSVRFTQPLTREASDVLRGHGVAAKAGEIAVNATLPQREIAVLSEMPWVRSIRLQGRSRLL